MPEHLMLEDFGVQPGTSAGSVPGSVAADAHHVTMMDISSLNFRAIYNKSIYQFLAQWAIYAYNLDDQLFAPGEPDWMAAAKSTALSVGIDLAASQLRQSFPMLIM